MIIKIVLLGVCVAFLSVMLRQYQKSFLLPLQLIFVALVVALILDDAVESLRSLADMFSAASSVSKLFTALFKGSLICIITKIACDICRESGNILVSDMIELGGRIMLLIISVPFIESVIKTAISFAS